MNILLPRCKVASAAHGSPTLTMDAAVAACKSRLAGRDVLGLGFEDGPVQNRERQQQGNQKREQPQAEPPGFVDAAAIQQGGQVILIAPLSRGLQPQLQKLPSG